MQNTAVEWIESQFANIDEIRRKMFDKAKEMEKQQEKEKLIGLLGWMNKVASNNPMALETDHDDIVEMYLENN